eukprot:455772-Hanusia_phi.AAC.1
MIGAASLELGRPLPVSARRGPPGPGRRTPGDPGLPGPGGPPGARRGGNLRLATRPDSRRPGPGRASQGTALGGSPGGRGAAPRLPGGEFPV